jgi:hypothetical protein
MENEDWFVDCKDTHSYRIGTQEETRDDKVKNRFGKA